MDTNGKIKKAQRSNGDVVSAQNTMDGKDDKRKGEGSGRSKVGITEQHQIKTAGIFGSWLESRYYWEQKAVQLAQNQGEVAFHGGQRQKRPGTL